MFKEYFENGKLKVKGEYQLIRDYKIVLTLSSYSWDPYDTYDSMAWRYKSVKSKTWEYYNTKGKLIRKEIYEQGKLIRKEDY